MAASGSSEVLDLIGRIRAAAAEGSARAHRAADEAGAGTHPEYRNAHRTEASAAALSGPADIIQAVTLYREAAADFATATGAAREADQLIRAGTDALQRGDIQRAIAEGTRALDRNPGDKRALELLASVRGRAQAAAMTARTEALKQGAGTSDRFTEAEAARQSAEKNTDPRQTVQQVAAFERARELYLLSAKDIGGRRAEAVRAIASGRSALERGDLQAAESALASALAADPNVDGAGALRSAIAARRKAVVDAKPAPPPTNTPPNPTPADPSRTPAAARAADRNAIAETLRAYERAYASLDASEVVKVAPFLAGRLERALANDFRNLRAYAMRIEAAEPTFSPDGNNARVRSKITRNIETRNTGKEPSRVQVSTLILQKRGGQWLITGIETEG
jgi:tetratricopeptide (TPR) repeat protein